MKTVSLQENIFSPKQNRDQHCLQIKHNSACRLKCEKVLRHFCDGNSFKMFVVCTVEDRLPLNE